MTDQQRIHPVDLEAAPAPSAPLVPRDHSRSDKGDPDAPPSPLPRRTIPVSHSPPPRKPRRNCCCRCLCWSLLTLILLIVAIAATLGILYLIFHPKIPHYSVDRLQVTNFTIDSNLTVHASFDVSVTARNPNKKVGIYYLGGAEDGLRVWYEDTQLASGRFPQLYQGHRNTTVLRVVMEGEAEIGSEVVQQLQQQVRTGTVPLRFRGDVPVKIKLGGLKLWKMTFGVRCDLVVDNLTMSSVIRIRSSSCKFKKFKLFSKF